MPTSVRIYVLHHPDSRLDHGQAESLTNRIYDWFRLPSLEGIPVYIRSSPNPDTGRPDMPKRQPGEQCVEYIVPLVDAHMVRDPVWHKYLADIAQNCLLSEKEGESGGAPEWGQKMFPVALDGTAFNLPDGIARMNFIRHGGGEPRFIVVPENTDEKKQRELQDAHDAELAEETLKHLTEAIARDLTVRLFPEQKSERFKIFISYARADSTEQAKDLRTYIQGQTQCLVFFDENDIGFGSAFEESLDENVSQYSKALIVLNSDRYAERSWCRWEIERFTRPRTLSLRSSAAQSAAAPGSAGQSAAARSPLPKDATPPQDTSPAARQTATQQPQGEAKIQVFHPVLVVDNMAGPAITRVVPELAQALVVRWAPNREKLYFSALMREVVLGLRAVLEARTIPWGDLTDAAVVNRLPGPVALARLLPGGISTRQQRPFTIHHPGYGLPFVELRLLEKTFPNVRFHAFRDIFDADNLPQPMKEAMADRDHHRQSLPLLSQQVIAISTAYHRENLARIGYLPQHQDEALIYLLRPLVRLGADLLYGGRPPKRHMETATLGGPTERNITLTLMQMLSAERSLVELEPGAATTTTATATATDQAPSRPQPLLFNISSWPACDKITEMDEASWINACHVQRVRPKDAGLPPWKKPVPGETEKKLPPHFRRHLALTFSRMRQILAGGFTCSVPGNLKRTVRPAAFIFAGGVLDSFKGVMPGVMEEFLRAAQARPPIPIYLIGGLGGATGVIAHALVTPGARPPAQLTQPHYTSHKAANHSEYNALLKDLSDAERRRVQQQFAQLWHIIKTRHRKNGLDQLFANGLDHDQNHTLLTTTNTVEAVGLIWQGLSTTLLGKPRPGEQPASTPAAKSAAKSSTKSGTKLKVMPKSKPKIKTKTKTKKAAPPP